MANDKPDVLHGSLALMVLRTLETLGPQHGWGIARRIEQISGDALDLKQGRLYPALLRLEQMGWITSKWGHPKTIGGPDFMGSRGPAGSSSPPKRRTGSDLRDHRPVHEAGEGIMMTQLRVFLRRIFGSLRKGDLERNIDEELDHHLQMEIAENFHKGMTAGEARSAALRRLGQIQYGRCAIRTYLTASQAMNMPSGSTSSQ
jgi:hypothetical protein